VCEYILKHYGEVENQAITIIYEEFSNLTTGCGYPEDFKRNPLLGEVVDLLKDFQAWETAWIAGAELPYYNECGFCYPVAMLQ
jgi:hypothetical protein